MAFPRARTSITSRRRRPPSRRTEWYSSPEYQEILYLRTDNAISDLILVDPLGANFTAAEWAGEIRGVIAAA